MSVGAAPGDAGADVVARVGQGVGVVGQDRARGRVEVAHQRGQHGALAGAGRAGQRDRAVRADGEVDVAHRVGVGVGPADGQVLGCERAGCGHRAWVCRFGGGCRHAVQFGQAGDGVAGTEQALGRVR